jgi:anti-sigma factor RsiW
MPELTCRDGVEMLMDYLEGILASPEREAIEAHVAGCPRCVAFVESYTGTPRILRAATAEALPADLADSLRRFLAARRASGEA